MTDLAPERIGTNFSTVSTPFGDLSAIDWKRVRAVSVDVFDTILMRDTQSEVTRLTKISRLAASRLETSGDRAQLSHALHKTRRLAQSLAFAARERPGTVGEVRLVDILRRQVSILGLTATAVTTLMDAELEIELDALRAETARLEWLRSVQSSGRKVFAISDTTLPIEALEHLLRAKLGRYFSVFSRVISSADVDATKRKGDIFKHVFTPLDIPLESVVHFGDDKHADKNMARSAGMVGVHVPRGSFYIRRRRLDGARQLAAQSVVPFWHSFRPNYRANGNSEGSPTLSDPDGAAHVIVELALRLWLYVDEAARDAPLQVIALSNMASVVTDVLLAFATSRDLPIGFSIDRHEREIRSDSEAHAAMERLVRAETKRLVLIDDTIFDTLFDVARAVSPNAIIDVISLEAEPPANTAGQRAIDLTRPHQRSAFFDARRRFARREQRLAALLQSGEGVRTAALSIASEVSPEKMVAFMARLEAAWALAARGSKRA